MAETQTQGEVAPQSFAQKAAAMVTGAATKAMDTATKLDEQYKVSENVAKATQAGLAKAQEINTKYEISTKAQTLATTATQSAQNVDTKLGISDGIKKGVAKVAEMDEKLGVSATVKATATSADERLGLSKKASEMDMKLGVTETGNMVGDMINQAANVLTDKLQSILTMSSYKVRQGEEQLTLVLDRGTVKVGEAEPVVVAPGMKAVSEGETVIMEAGETSTFTFASAAEATAFAEKFTMMAAPAEEEVAPAPAQD